MDKSQEGSLQNENESCDIQWGFETAFMTVVSKEQKGKE